MLRRVKARGPGAGRGVGERPGVGDMDGVPGDGSMLNRHTISLDDGLYGLIADHNGLASDNDVQHDAG